MLFSDECKERIFSEVSDIGQIVEYVTGKTEVGRNTEAIENFVFCFFLIVCFVKSKIALPIKVLRRRKEQSPDFILCYGIEKKLLGLEHSRATTEKYKEDESIFEQYPEGSLLELPYYSPSRRLPKKSRIAMRKPGEKLMSNGWGDYGMENDCAQLVTDAIDKKTEKLNAPHFEKFSSNELIVQDVSHVSSLKRLDKTIQLLREKDASSTKDARTKYDKIHLITEHSLVYDVFKDNETTSLKKDDLLKMWTRFTA